MAKKKRSSTATIILLVIAAVAVAGIGYFVYAHFQVRHVVAEGNAMYTGPYIAALANVPQGMHMFEVDRQAIAARIENAEPYLRVTAIERRYPDTVAITVEERRPMALLPYGNQYLLVDAEATVLETVADPESLETPVVEGISVSGAQIGASVATEDEFKIAVMQEILQELKTRGLFDLIVSVDLSNINNIQLTSENGLRIRFGQAEKTPDKVKWIANRLPALEREGQSDGILDVSAGSFATYTMIDGAPAASRQPSSNPSQDTDESSGQSSAPDDEGSSAGEEED